jgi:hypothetical protein
MRFLVLLASEDHFDAWDAADDTLRARTFADYAAFAAAVRARGTLVVGDALHRPEEARTRRPGPDRLVTDGPYAEAKEHLAGFFLIDVESRERAEEIVVKFSGPGETVELRPVMVSGGPDQ